MQHTVIDEADFGIPASALVDDGDLFTRPVAVVEQRTPAAPQPAPTPGVALAAAKAEVDAIGTTFVFEGETYFVQPAEEWDVEVFEAAEDGKFVSAVKLLLGAAQWKRFKAGKRRVSRDVEAIFVAAQRALGTKSR